MRPVYVSTSAAGSTIVPLDYHRTPFNVGLGVIPITGTPLPTVQHTFDPVETTAQQAAAVWFNHTTLVSVSTTADGNYAFPIVALRLNQPAAGSVRMIVVQAGLYN